MLGVDLATGPRIDRWQVTAGRDLARRRRGTVGRARSTRTSPTNITSRDTGTIRVGDLDVRYVGLALSPEYLNLTTTSGEAIQGQATRAVLFAPLALAERLAGTSGQVDDVVVRLCPGVDVERATASIGGGARPKPPGRRAHGHRADATSRRCARSTTRCAASGISSTSSRS